MDSDGAPVMLVERRKKGPRADVALLAAEVQLLLAEKRTSLSVMRTGIAILVLPLSVTTVLVTLSRFYDWVENLQFLLPMYTVMSALVLLGGYLTVRSLHRIRKFDDLVFEIRSQSKDIAELVQ